jgi:sialate O-acetylesterase
MKWLLTMLMMVWLLQPNCGLASVRLPALISDGMILQRDQKISVWGWAKPGEQVTVTFNQRSCHINAGPAGTWKTVLPAHQAGGPYIMTITGENQLVIRDILFGDVWLCSGQSNMEYILKRSQVLYANDIAQADNPQIRQFAVKLDWSYTAKDNVAPAKWQAATPTSVLNFSAAAYFFAKALYAKYHIPIGLINSSYGGTPIESWMSEDAIKKFPGLLTEYKTYQDTAKVNLLLRAYKANTTKWYADLKKQDAGINHANGTPLWVNDTTQQQNWQPIQVPGFWEDQGLSKIDGIVWYRKEINISAALAGKDALLNLGFIHQEDSTYFNGKIIGNTTSQYLERRYRVPGELIKAGKSIITVRILNKEGNGGFLKDKIYILNIGSSIPLAGQWQYRLGASVPPLQTTGQIQFSREPAVLYNSMIAPLVQYRIKGVLWYQGEANTSEPQRYATLFASLIQDWRKQWGQETLPFIYAQLANYMPVNNAPGNSRWAQLREAQSQTLKIPKTGMAVLHDTGEWNDVHPTRKKEAGERLALAAQHVAYREELVYSGPVYKAAKIKGQRIIISFKKNRSNLIAKGGALTHFAIASTDGKFVWAKAEIVGGKIVVWNNEVLHPVAVRYAWADNPAGANLYNAAGLPASSFRTDEW